MRSGAWWSVAQLNPCSLSLSFSTISFFYAGQLQLNRIVGACWTCSCHPAYFKQDGVKEAMLEFKVRGWTSNCHTHLGAFLCSQIVEEVTAVAASFLSCSFSNSGGMGEGKKTCCCQVCKVHIQKGSKIYVASSHNQASAGPPHLPLCCFSLEIHTLRKLLVNKSYKAKQNIITCLT